MKNKNKLLIILSLIVLCLFVGLSYALWLVNKAQNNTNIVSSGCFEISTDLGTSNELDPIMLENAFPMTDSRGMHLDPFTFTLTNTCTVYANYQINLETLNTTTLGKDYLKAVLNTSNPQVLSAYESVEKTLTDATSSNKLLTGGLKPGKSKTFNLRLWMDENTTQEQGENKLYEGQIVVIETPSKDPTPVNTCTYEGTLTQGAEYTDGTYTYRYMQEYQYNKELYTASWVNITEDGWGVKLSDTSATGEINSKICTSINGKPIVSMSYMFYYAEDLTIIDVSSFDTSSVVRMNDMFDDTGVNSSSFEIIGLSNFDTSNVTDMSYMFYSAGYKATAFNLDLSSWDTSSVTDMNSMFYLAGYNSSSFEIIGLNNFDTSSVTNMSYMFSRSGMYDTTWSVGDLSRWDTSNVTDMSFMFEGTGSNTTTWSIGNLSNWDVSNVTTMESMFGQAGTKATTFELDLSSWDTSKVTNMSQMFSNAGKNATVWSIGDLSSWDTSKVTNMSSMFSSAGYNSSSFEIIGLNSWDTSSVVNMSSMFYNSGYNSSSWNIGDLSSWDTSNVNSMRYMFYYAGFKATTWNSIGTLKVNATNIYNMFSGCPNAKATLNIYSNPSSGTSGYDNAFTGAARFAGSGIIVNYSSATTNIDAIIATKSSTSNVVKGVQLD